MEDILLGVAFGQILAAIIVVLLQLAVSIFFWWVVQLAWKTVQRWSRAATSSVLRTWMRAR